MNILLFIWGEKKSHCFALDVEEEKLCFVITHHQGTNAKSNNVPLGMVKTECTRLANLGRLGATHIGSSNNWCQRGVSSSGHLTVGSGLGSDFVLEPIGASMS